MIVKLLLMTIHIKCTLKFKDGCSSSYRGRTYIRIESVSEVNILKILINKLGTTEDSEYIK